MKPESHLARRYHWHSASVRNFVSEPHTAIVGKPVGEILNLVDARAERTQEAFLTIAREPVTNALNDSPRLIMPMHHNVQAENIDLKRLGAVLAAAHEQELRDFASLLLVEGLGRGRGSVAIRRFERTKADMVQLLMLPRNRKSVRGFVPCRRFSFALS